MTALQKITIIAPAKINLFLHVIGKNDAGYHNLQSLIAFANFGDEIIITPSDEFKFSFDSTAANLPHDENNLIICAANLLEKALDKNLNCHIHLTKSIPIGAGLGGGSSDAAATIKGLLQFWNAQIDDEALNDILLNLGADVPSCYYQSPCYIEGIGEIITPIEVLPQTYGLLIYPNEHCSTQDVFKSYDSIFSKKAELPTKFPNSNDLLKFILNQKNDLTLAAIERIPEIQNILDVLENKNNCLLARMSGSGSACFGLFKTKEQSLTAFETIKDQHPEWWVHPIQIS